MFADQSCFGDVVEILTVEDFYRSAHQKIYAAICELGNNNKPVDLVTVASMLRRRGELEECGGPAYLAAIVETPMSTKVSHPCGIVKDKAVRRRMIECCQNGIKNCFEKCNCETGELVGEIQASVLDVNEAKENRKVVLIGDAVQDAMDVFRERQINKGGITGIPTGFSKLDFQTGGFHGGDYIIIAARPSMGKTAFALNIAQNAADITDSPVAIFSLEMPASQLTQRMIASTARVDSHRIRTGQLSDRDWERITSAADSVSRLPIHISDDTDLTQVKFRNQLRRMKKKQGIKLAIIDYLQLMRAVQVQKRINNTNDEVSEISRSIKIAAGELDIPIIVLSQLNRDLENRADKRPKLSDLRDSGSLEQDADVVMFIYRDEVYNKDENNPNRGKAEIDVAKQRNGPTGTSYYAWLGAYTRFENLAYGEDWR